MSHSHTASKYPRKSVDLFLDHLLWWPHFLAHPVLWPNNRMDQDANWYMEVGLCPGDIVLDGEPDPPERGTAAPTHFSVHVYCGQTVVHLS